MPSRPLRMAQMKMGTPTRRSALRTLGRVNSRSETGASPRRTSGCLSTTPAAYGVRGRRPHTARLALRDADEVAGGVAERAVAGAPALVHRLLEDVGPGGPDLLERGVEVVGGEHQPVEHALGQQGAERVGVGRVLG